MALKSMQEIRKGFMKIIASIKFCLSRLTIEPYIFLTVVGFSIFFTYFPTTMASKLRYFFYETTTISEEAIRKNIPPLSFMLKSLSNVSNIVVGLVASLTMG